MAQETDWFAELQTNEARHERCFWRRVAALAIGGFLAAVTIGAVLGMVLYSAKAGAALNYRAQAPNGQSVGLRLSDAPCTNEKVKAHLAAVIRPEYLDKFKAAVLTWGGRDWHSCWFTITVIDQGGREHEMVWSLDEEGSPFNPPYGIPKQMFREDAI